MDTGMAAPDFALQDADGRTVRLSDFRGRKIVLYFYPQDDTPGCTKEACAFRDDHQVYTERDAVVIGISPDDTDSHARFAKKCDLPFTLLADPDHAVSERYGVWVLKNRYGRTYYGVERTTFLIDPEGRIARIFPKVKPDGHSLEVLDALAAL